MSIIIGVGSNINPLDNFKQAYNLLKAKVTIVAQSSIYESKAYNMSHDANNFLNAVLLIESSFSFDDLKYKILRPIEEQLGYNKSPFLNRKIDLDILFFKDEINNLVPDKYCYSRNFIYTPLLEIKPDFFCPKHKKLYKYCIVTDNSFLAKTTNEWK